MKLITYSARPSPLELRSGIVVNHSVFDLASVLESTPRRSLLELLESGELSKETAQATLKGLLEVNRQTTSEQQTLALDDVMLRAPLPEPRSLRDFYSFEGHVRNSRRKRGLEMVPEWYDFPVFYYSNPRSVYGPDDVIPYPQHSSALDYELEIACVIGKKGIDIREELANEYIAGYTVMNDWSARDIQAHEMKVGLGPTKGKDFATSLGPYIVTPDELEDKRVSKNRYDLVMVARVNGKEYSRGNFNGIYWTFPQMISRASQDVYLYPGEVIGSGTVGTGCILELGPEKYGWLKPGDVVELEVERLGVLRNTVGEARRKVQ